jgi:hypothetical protein
VRSNAASEKRLSVRVVAREDEELSSWACCSWRGVAGEVMSIGAEDMIIFVEVIEQSRQVI